MRKIKYDLRCSFKYDKVTLEIEAEDGDMIAPEELAGILEEVLLDYEDLDLGEGIH